jgi:hypothetical protein
MDSIPTSAMATSAATGAPDLSGIAPQGMGNTRAPGVEV